jgi:hypothetical protein
MRAEFGCPFATAKDEVGQAVGWFVPCPEAAHVEPTGGAHIVVNDHATGRNFCRNAIEVFGRLVGHSHYMGAQRLSSGRLEKRSPITVSRNWTGFLEIRREPPHLLRL